MNHETNFQLADHAGRTPARLPTHASRYTLNEAPKVLAGVKRPHSISVLDDNAYHSKHIPLAEQLRKIETKLPERFRIQPTNRKFSPPPRRLTKPVSPKLRTSYRSKFYPQPLITPPPEPFRARPVNPRILSSKGNLGVPRIVKNKPTIAKAPNFSQPRPRSANPHVPKPAQPRIAVRHRKPIVVKPFKFATDRIADFKKKELERKLQIQKQEEERKRQFKARPMPTFTPEKPRPRPPRPTTVPHEFSFLAEARSEYHRNLRLNKLSEKPRSPSPFRARPVPKFDHSKIIRVSSRPPTKPLPILLHSDIRMQQRRQFEQQRQLKLTEEQRLRDLELQRQKECEESKVRRLRNELVPKAKPMPRYNFFQIKKSTKPLTEPRSPNFRKRCRLF